MPSQSLPATRRLRRRAEFQRVFDGGRRAHGRYLTILASPAAGADTRLGIVASRKLGGAVVRNRAKRLIRQVFRTNSGPVSPVDLVVIPKAAAKVVKAADLANDFTAILIRMGLSRQ